MDEAAATTSSGALFRAFAAGLGELRRSPGKDDTWVEGVLRVLERDHPERYGRLARRLGFARRLSDLAQLRVEEDAIATIGVFCYELIGERLPAPTPGGPWMDYVYRNERWLGPCLRVCESLYAPTWNEIESRPALIARFVVAYDRRTIEEHERPLQVIQSLVESALTEEGDRLGPLVWSEDGQELCDFHFRRKGDYGLDAKDVKRSFELLKRVLPAPGAAATAPRQGPVRTPVTMPIERARKARDEEQAPVQAGANFERRRQALRAQRADGSEREVPRPAPALEEEKHEVGAPDESILRQQEDAMERPQIAVLPAYDGDGANITKRIEMVRAQLDQIRRIAADTQEMLADLAPQVEELAAWVSDVESVLNRRTGPRRAA